MSSALERLKMLRDKQKALTSGQVQESKQGEKADEKQLQQHESNQSQKEESKEAPADAVGAGTSNQIGKSETGRGDVVSEEIKPSSTHPLAMEMAELANALENQVPGFATILKKIHSHLQKDPNVVTLLSEEEIGTIVAGLEKHTNVAIVAPASIKAAKKKTPITADDL